MSRFPAGGGGGTRAARRPARSVGRRGPAVVGLVAVVTLCELTRRRGALLLATLLPLSFYLVRMDTHWTALRLLSIGLGWAAATLFLFVQVPSRSVDHRLAAAGAPPSALLVGRHLAVLALGWGIALVYCALVLATIRDELTRPAAVPVMLLVTTTVAAPLGSLAAAVVPRDLEGRSCSWRSWRCRCSWIRPRSGRVYCRCGARGSWRATSSGPSGATPRSTCVGGSCTGSP